jgi:hypothetical protein
VSSGNWTWRFTPERLESKGRDWLASLTKLYARAPEDAADGDDVSDEPPLEV